MSYRALALAFSTLHIIDYFPLYVDLGKQCVKSIHQSETDLRAHTWEMVKGFCLLASAMSPLKIGESSNDVDETAMNCYA